MPAIRASLPCRDLSSLQFFFRTGSIFLCLRILSSTRKSWIIGYSKIIFFFQYFFSICLGASSTRSYITKGSRYAKENQTKWNGLLSFSFGLCDFGMMRFLNFRARPPPKSWQNVSRHHHSRYCKNQDFSKSQFVFATNLPSRQAQRFWSPSELYFHCDGPFQTDVKIA